MKQCIFQKVRVICCGYGWSSEENSSNATINEENKNGYRLTQIIAGVDSHAYLLFEKEADKKDSL